MSRRHARRAAPLLALLLAGCSAATSGPAATTAPSGTVDRTCADLVVIGARGSTQDPDLNGGVGTEVRVTLDRLVALVHRRSGASVHLEPIRYDASAPPTLDTYQDHVAEGARMMTSRLRSLARTCADSRFALIGFSQGAQVVHAAAADMSSSLARRVALVAMIADPRNNPHDRIKHWSYGAEPARGGGRLGPGTPIDANLRDVAISLCNPADEICNDRGAPGGPPSATHKHFYEQPATAAITAAHLDRVLRVNDA